MKKIDLNKDWLFYYSTMMFSLPGVNIEKQRVTLPHDFIINLPRKKDGEAANGYEGRTLLAIVSDAPGEIQVSISADGLKGALMMLTAE